MEEASALCGFASPALPLAVIMKGMTMGTVMYKVRSTSRWYRRKYRVDIQNLRLAYSPSTKPFWRGKMTAADLYNLEEVRKGWNTDVFNKLEEKFRRKLQATLHPQLRSKLKEENCFSLIFSPDHATVDLIAPNVHARDAWVKGLQQLIACCKRIETEHGEEIWLKEQVRKADVNGNGSLNFEECLGLLNQLNISMRRREARKLFDASNFRKVKIDGDEALEPDEFVHFYKSLTRRPEMEELMKQYSVSRSALWSAEELRNFLKTEQHMYDASLEDCETLIEEYEPKHNKISGYLSHEGFKALMMSPEYDIFNKRHRIIYQDMNLPLTYYYIASSHNTYLMRGQLIGDSSIEGYIKALQMGCRCLELDTWDGPDNEPIIFHGYTLTSRIFLRDVLDAIKQYAFKASQYPVILSIENHCSVPQQIQMAHHFKTILGDYLYKDPVDPDEICFPSPEALARKILIKGKKLRDSLDPMMSPENELLEDEEEKEMALAVAMAAAPVPPVEGEELPDIPMAASAKYHAVAQELSDLVNYVCPRRFQSFEECENSWKFYEMSSFQETVALNLGKEEGTHFVEYNRKHLSRIYPKGTRTDSSNYDPIPYWNVGCQLVALNYQTRDFPMYLNQARFAQNGRCGYVLKPDFLITGLEERFEAYDPEDAPHPDIETHVTIKVISGQFLPKPLGDEEGEVIDPYVSIKVVGHPLDEQKKKTRWINNNGFNPTWNEALTFVLKAPELAIFHIRVKTQNVASNALIGQFALPCSSINEGYRYVHLEDSYRESLDPAAIFVHIEKTRIGNFRKASKVK